jgi:hypothetical protein
MHGVLILYKFRDLVMAKSYLERAIICALLVDSSFFTETFCFSCFQEVRKSILFGKTQFLYVYMVQANHKSFISCSQDALRFYCTATSQVHRSADNKIFGTCYLTIGQDISDFWLD